MTVWIGLVGATEEEAAAEEDSVEEGDSVVVGY